MSKPVRLAVLCDYAEEGWPSMDLVGSMIVEHLNRLHGDEVEATAIIPPFRTWLGRRSGSGFARNADRMLNRHADYPRLARALAKGVGFDLFHVVDHSYAHLVGALPKGRSVVTCHDLDAFRCLLEPAREPRPAWFKALARRTLRGLGRAAFVAADSDATSRGLIENGIVPEAQVRTIHLGTHPECSPEADPRADSEASRLLGPARGPELLHVGSNIPRKRVDVLLDAFAKIREVIPDARLVGDAAEYRGVGDVEARAAAALAMLHEGPEEAGRRRAAGMAGAARFGRDRHVGALVEIYRGILDRGDLGKV